MAIITLLFEQSTSTFPALQRKKTNLVKMNDSISDLFILPSSDGGTNVTNVLYVATRHNSIELSGCI
jgi:hypothetical protein